MNVLYVMLPVNLDTSRRIVEVLKVSLGLEVSTVVLLDELETEVRAWLSGGGLDLRSSRPPAKRGDLGYEATCQAFRYTYGQYETAARGFGDVREKLGEFGGVLDSVHPDVVLCDGNTTPYIVGCAQYARAKGYPVIRWEHISVPGVGEHVFAFDRVGMFFNRGDTELHERFDAYCEEFPPDAETRARDYLESLRSSCATRDSHRNTEAVRLPDVRGPRVFVPGQISFDSNVLGCERRYKTTEALAIALALANPSLEVIYKPHPGAGDFDTGANMIDLENVTVMSRKAKVYDLMQQSSATVCLSSNVGLESILHGFMTFCASSTHYNLAGLCGDLLATGVAGIAERLEGGRPQEDRVLRYVAALLDYVVDLDEPDAVLDRLEAAIKDPALQQAAEEGVVAATEGGQ